MNTEQKTAQSVEPLNTTNGVPQSTAPDPNLVEWSRAEIKSTWDEASRATSDALEGLKRYVRGGVEEPVVTRLPAPELYRLNRGLTCGTSEPWANLPAFYDAPVPVEGRSLHEIASNLSKAGTPLQSGDVVTLEGGAHVFEPQNLAIGAQPVSAASPAWHESLATPEMAAVLAGSFVAVKVANRLLEPKRARTIVEHGR